jgi:hypothetical protein
MAQFVLVAVTLGGIYYQLRAQASANALQRMQFFIDQWESTAMSHDRLRTALHLKRGELGRTMEPSMVSIAGFFETLGLLERRGHVSRDEVFLLGRSVQMWWALLSHSIAQESARQAADLYVEFRRLVGIMQTMDAKVGEHYVLDAASIPGILDDVIRLNRGHLIRARDVAAGVIPGEPSPVASGADADHPPEGDASRDVFVPGKAE